MFQIKMRFYNWLSLILWPILTKKQRYIATTNMLLVEFGSNEPHSLLFTFNQKLLIAAVLMVLSFSVLADNDTSTYYMGPSQAEILRFQKELERQQFIQLQQQMLRNQQYQIYLQQEENDRQRRNQRGIHSPPHYDPYR